MIRDVLRTVGAGCLLAGGILYFTDGGEDVSNKEMQQMQDEVVKLRSELSKTEEELAIAQITSSTKKKGSTYDEKVEDSIPESVLTIEPGSNSTVVSTSLESLGIIEDASAFNAYLADNGLSGKIQIGEHQLDSSMDFQTIAKKITTSK